MTTDLYMGSGHSMAAPRYDADGHYHVDDVFSPESLTVAHSHEALSHGEPVEIITPRPTYYSFS